MGSRPGSVETVSAAAVALRVVAGDYFTDGSHLLWVTEVAPPQVVCEDASHPDVAVVMLLDDLAAMRRVKPVGVSGG